MESQKKSTILMEEILIFAGKKKTLRITPNICKKMHIYMAEPTPVPKKKDLKIQLYCTKHPSLENGGYKDEFRTKTYPPDPKFSKIHTMHATFFPT